MLILFRETAFASEKGVARPNTMDNARYIDSLRGHLDSGGVVNACWTLL